MTLDVQHALAGHVALVTGGGTGIGRSIARTFLEAGAAVAIAGRRAEVLERAARELEGVGAPVVPLAGDVSNPSDAKRLVERTLAELGALHVLVNNAGVARGGPIEALSDDDVDLIVDVDLKGPIHMIRAALAALRAHREQGGASILNLGTSVTLAPIKNFSVYAAAKAGVDVLTRALALELARDRIRVNALCPGIIETPIFETMMPAREVEPVLRHFGRAVPLGRVGTPADVAALALFLVSTQGSYITGAVIPIDGGLSLAADGK